MRAFVSQEITFFFEKILDFADMAIKDQDTYKKFRSKVLRLGNDAIRNCCKEFDDRTQTVEAVTVSLSVAENIEEKEEK